MNYKINILSIRMELVIRLAPCHFVFWCSQLSAWGAHEHRPTQLTAGCAHFWFLEGCKLFVLTLAAASLWTESKPTSVKGNSVPSSNRCEVFIQVINRVITRRSEGAKFLSKTLKYVASCIYGLLVRLWSTLNRLKRMCYQGTIWALTTKVTTTS